MAILFSAGRILTTRGVNNRMTDDADFCVFVYRSLSRHLNGDWGDMDDEGKFSNDKAAKGGHSRIFSAYIYDQDSTKIWIITEADRNATVVLFPNEY